MTDEQLNEIIKNADLDGHIMLRTLGHCDRCNVVLIAQELLRIRVGLDSLSAEMHEDVARMRARVDG